MANNFQNLGADAALQAAQAVTTHVSTAPNSWGITSLELSILNDGYDDLQSAINAQTNAINSMKAATKAKAQALDTLVAGLSAASKSAYATPTVTDTMLAQIGFAPRATTGPKPQVLVAPAGLVAAPSSDGTVRLSWDRAGSRYGTIFVVETSPDGVDWTMIKSTTRVSYVADGFAPGVAAWFRVTATTSVSSSQPSLPVTIYVTGAKAFTKPNLKLAA